MAWRLIVRYGHGQETHDLPDVQALREVVMQLRRDPRVHGFRWRRLVELEAREDGCPRCGTPYLDAYVSRWPCRCGVPHVAYRCGPCRTIDIEPAPGEDCAPLPVDREGVNDRYSSKRWRRTR